MTLINSELVEDIGEVTRQVWENILDLAADAEHPAGAAPTTVFSSVQIIGEWSGAVSLSMTEDLAAVVASTMFEMGLDELSREDVDDAVGEMANMIGGNIKCLLPGPSQLSMPTVVSGERPPHFPGTQVFEHLEFNVAGQPFDVTVLHESSAARTESEGSPS